MDVLRNENCPEALCQCVMVDPGLFGDVQKGNCTWNQMQLMYSIDSDNLPVFLSLDRFVPKNVGFAKSRQITNISRQILIKPKSFTWKYIRMNPNVIFSHKVERSQSPLNFVKQNQVMFKRLDYPRICVQLLHASSERIESIC